MRAYGTIEEVLQADDDIAHGRKPNPHGLWCMVRYECNDCGMKSPALWLQEAIDRGVLHSEQFHHDNIELRHGFFFKSQYGQEEPAEGLDV